MNPITFNERVQRILDHSAHEFSLADIHYRLEEKSLYAFEVKGVLLLLEIMIFPQKKVLNIFGLEGPGALEELAALREFCTELGRSLGCSELRCHGRAGWLKALKETGATPLYTVMTLEL